jgi:hypothetical protein
LVGSPTALAEAAIGVSRPVETAGPADQGAATRRYGRLAVITF